jgi:ABC-2 type transport system permease protein
MSLRSLLRKELHWSRHNLGALLFVLLLLPAFFASTSLVFGTVVPRDAPVAVTPESEAVTEDELGIIAGAFEPFSDPKLVDTPAEAERMLRRESVYAVVRVPPDITNASNDNATFLLTVDGSITPFERPSRVIRFVMEDALDDAPFLDADISVRRQVIGSENSLSEYLIPSFLLAVLILFAFTYVPYNLAREADVLDRIRAESSLEALIASKLVYFTLLMLVPILVFQAAAAAFGYTATPLSVGTVLTLLLTFVYLAAISMTVMVLLRFGSLGRFVNVVLLLGVVSFSGLAFPVGYLSPIRKAIIRAVPVHYSAIITRSLMLKDVDLALFADWLAGLAGFAALTLVALKLGAVYYRRSA